jgi:hypothetical protein
MSAEGWLLSRAWDRSRIAEARPLRDSVHESPAWRKRVNAEEFDLGNGDRCW